MSRPIEKKSLLKLLRDIMNMNVFDRDAPVGESERLEKWKNRVTTILKNEDYY